jgi:hypothetical protein
MTVQRQSNKKREAKPTGKRKLTNPKQWQASLKPSIGSQ